MGDAAPGFDLGPPDAAMAEADAVLVERLGDDDVIDARARQDALLGEIGDAAIAAGFLVGGAGDFDGAGMVWTEIEEGLDGDDGGSEPTLHVAGAAPVNLAVPDDAGEGIDRPAMAGLDDIDVGIEMDARARRAPFPARHHIPARIAVGVAGRALGADETSTSKPRGFRRAAM